MTLSWAGPGCLLGFLGAGSRVALVPSSGLCRGIHATSAHSPGGPSRARQREESCAGCGSTSCISTTPLLRTWFNQELLGLLKLLLGSRVPDRGQQGGACAVVATGWLGLTQLKLLQLQVPFSCWWYRSCALPLQLFLESCGHSGNSSDLLDPKPCSSTVSSEPTCPKLSKAKLG